MMKEGTKNIMGLCFLTGIVAILPYLIRNDYYIGIFVFTAINCLPCIGLSLLMGYAGQISLGHAAFVGIGAYTSAILTVSLGWSPWLAMFCGILLSITTALLVGIPSLRLKGHYLAMASLGFASIMHIISVAAVDLTGGPAGISDIPQFSLLGWDLNNDVKFYYFSWGLVILGMFFALNLINSRIGRGLLAIHGNEEAAAAAGVNTARAKLRIFIISAVYASVAGSLYAGYVNYIDPGPFDVMHSVLLVTMVAVGGMHNVWGALSGALLLSVLPEFLSFSSDFFQDYGIAYQPDYDTLIYGSILLLIMLFLPEGLLAGLGTAIKSIRRFRVR